MSKTIEVTGCHDCPFSGFNEDSIEHYCNHHEVDDYRPITMLQSIHEDCPLKKEPIKIKLKDDEKELPKR